MRPHRIRPALILCVTIIAGFQAQGSPKDVIQPREASRHQAPPEYLWGYAGTLPGDPTLLAGTYFDDPPVQALIHDIAQGPVSRQQVLEALARTHFTIDDLLRVKLLREERGRYVIGFNYFTAGDMEAIIGAARRYVPSLVEAYLNRRSAFQRAFDRYPVKSVAPSRLAFVLVAGFGLNWDGLTITRDLGLRDPVLVQGDGFQYSFWASEEVPGHDTHGFYWGSSTLPAGAYNYSVDPVDYSFSSFGDPYSDPRMNFPDLLLTPAASMAPDVRRAAERVGLVHDTSFGGDFRDVLGFERGRDIGAALFALRASPKKATQLAPILHDSAKTDALLGLLQEAQYVTRDSMGVYHLVVPVLDVQDARMVRDVLALNREILTAWLTKTMPALRRDLGVLTAMREGVPFESLFTQIWHELFGLATRELVRAEFMFDPGGSDLRYRGSYPVVWRHALYQLGGS